MNKLNAVALANTFAIIDLVLHPLFHLWIWVSPGTYEWAMNIFIAGLKLNVTSFDSGLSHVVLGTVLEAAVFWILGYSVAFLYNRLSK
ncbi:hypothetical protein A3A39_01030 [Candidatus Kaiserbacteria bacterium RIFCSPLOWO2_01_FULL_54_13]|uniref:DUF2062 domain-containing protein n=1 Tax=Candidatus Kaiserbacteria bacterium RIFCSPLOWO2_01_FULL_54_13 TaxID=1798512 RepID=A0A1F6F289_9BACT|nr:MAG: hypothetical protein A3A39_01030 [Candidatus Kaiserbacteria bacterium RIFCSPLOWO2_01_FULL_54_13]